MELTHDLLGEIAAKYLRKNGWHLALSNLWATSGEKPDCLAFNIYCKTFLVEAKTSRSDFFADKKKAWRTHPELAAGHYRAYITPPGLLRVEEIPYGWQLWEVEPGKNPKVKVIKGQEFYKAPPPSKSSVSKITLNRFVNYSLEEHTHFINCDAGLREGYSWLLTLLRRIEASGVDLQQFAASNELWGKK